jgi:hypothetical protein
LRLRRRRDLSDVGEMGRRDVVAILNFSLFAVNCVHVRII